MRAFRALTTHFVILGVILFVAFILGIIYSSIGHHKSMGSVWFVMLGAAIGWMAGFISLLVGLRPWRITVQVRRISYKDHKISVGVGRAFGNFTLTKTLDTQSFDFEEDLHQAVAEAKHKAAALQLYEK